MDLSTPTFLDNETRGIIVEILRKKAGYTQQQLSMKAHLSGAVVSNMEGGRGSQEPRLSSIQSVADALDVPPDVLLFKEAAQRHLDSVFGYNSKDEDTNAQD